MLEDKLKAIKKDAEAVKQTFPNLFNVLQLASAFKMVAPDAQALLNAFKAYGFLSESEKGFSIALHPDQRTINLNKAIEMMKDQVKILKKAQKEASDIRSLTFKEKISR